MKRNEKILLCILLIIIFICCALLITSPENNTIKTSVTIDVELDMYGNAIVTESWLIKNNSKTNQIFTQYIDYNKSKIGQFDINKENINIVVNGTTCKKNNTDNESIFTYKQSDDNAAIRNDIYLSNKKTHKIQIKYTLKDVVKYIDKDYYLFVHDFLSNKYANEISKLKINIKSPNDFTQTIERATGQKQSIRKNIIKISDKKTVGIFNVIIKLENSNLANISSDSLLTNKDIADYYNSLEEPVKYASWGLQIASMFASFIDFEYVNFESAIDFLKWFIPVVVIFLCRLAFKKETNDEKGINWEERATKVAGLSIVIILYCLMLLTNPFGSAKKASESVSIDVQIDRNGHATVTETWTIESSKKDIQTFTQHVQRIYSSVNRCSFELLEINVDGTACYITRDKDNEQPFTYKEDLNNGQQSYEIFMKNDGRKSHTVKVTYLLKDIVKCVSDDYYLFTYVFSSNRHKNKIKNFTIKVTGPNNSSTPKVVNKTDGTASVFKNTATIFSEKVLGEFVVQVRLDGSKFNRLNSLSYISAANVKSWNSKNFR